MKGARLDAAFADFWKAPFALLRNRWLSSSWRRAVRGYDRIQEALRAQIAERRANPGADLFSRMCTESRQARWLDWLDDDLLVRIFIGVMGAAFDTTSAGVASMAYLLAKHPSWQERLREEARAVSAEAATYDTTRRLSTIEMAWKESLRLYPVAPDMPRVALRDVMLGEHRIPAGTLVLVVIAPAMMDPSIWTNPEDFDPLRFSEGRAEDRRRRGAYLPFGAGAHACIGMHLATVEAKAFWHAMLSRCRFRLEPDYRAHHMHVPLGTVSGKVRLALDPL